MNNFINKLYKKIHIIQNIYLKNKFLIKRKTYAMEGEDLEIVKILKNFKNGFYVDAGGYHPLDRNNTYLLYKNNWRGINIDLSEFSIDLFNFIRPDDININVSMIENYLAVKYHGQSKTDIEAEHLMNRFKLIELGVFTPNEAHQ